MARPFSTDRSSNHRFGLRTVFLLVLGCGLLLTIYRPHVIKSRSEKAILLRIAELTEDREMQFSDPEGVPGARYVGAIYFGRPSIHADNITELKGLLSQLPHLVCIDLGQSNISHDMVNEIVASTTAAVGRNSGGLRRYPVSDLKLSNAD